MLCLLVIIYSRSLDFIAVLVKALVVLILYFPRVFFNDKSIITDAVKKLLLWVPFHSRGWFNLQFFHEHVERQHRNFGAFSFKFANIVLHQI